MKRPCWKIRTKSKNIWVLSKKGKCSHLKKRGGINKATGKITLCFALAGEVTTAANFPNINLILPLRQQLHKPENGMKISTLVF